MTQPVDVDMRRAKWRADNRRFRERNPERAREIRRQAMKRYTERHGGTRPRKPLTEEQREQAKARNRKSRYAKIYGITIEQYDEMLEQQNGGCAICGRADSGRKNCPYLDIDHDHETGRVRGLLCHPCNVALGFLEENVERLKAIEAYLAAR